MQWEHYNHLIHDDWRLILLAVTVGFLTSVVAVSLFHRARASAGRVRALWLATTGGAIGYGIWATHFIAMLAHDFAIPVGYDFTLTLASLLAAAGLTGTGFAVAVRAHGPSAAVYTGGVIFGLGVILMHYIGIAAMQMPGQIVWSHGLVLASLAFALVFGVAAMLAAVRSDAISDNVLASAFITVAIVGLHFTGMAAMNVVPDNAMAIGDSVQPLALSIAIASGAVAVLGTSLVAALAAASRQKLIAASTAELASQARHLQAALTNMSQGLGMFDSEQRLVVSNARYADMCGISPEQAKPGTSFRDLLQLRVAQAAIPWAPARRRTSPT